MILSPTPQTASAYRYPYPPDSIGLQISHGYIDGLNAIWWRTMHHTRGIGEANHNLCSKRQLSYTNGICLFLVSASSAFEPSPPSIAPAWLSAISHITSVGRKAASDIHNAPHTSA